MGAELLDQIEEVWQRSAEPVKTSGDHSVAFSGYRNEIVESWTARQGSRGHVGPHPLAAGRVQCVELAGDALVAR